MGGFDFGQITPVISETMDTDRMDIGRRMEILRPDLTTGETDPRIPIFRDIPCQIEFVRSDNVNPITSDTAPVIVSLRIHCNLDVDIQNADYVHAHVCDHAGTVLETYSGEVGFHTVDQVRKYVMMTMART